MSQAARHLCNPVFFSIDKATMEALTVNQSCYYYKEENRYSGLKKSLFRSDLKIAKYFSVSAQRLISKVSN
jgi:hypothetical protein